MPSELSGRVHSPPQRIRPSVCDNGLSMPFSDHVDRLSGAGMAVGPGGLA